MKLKLPVLDFVHFLPTLLNHFKSNLSEFSYLKVICARSYGHIEALGAFISPQKCSQQPCAWCPMTWKTLYISQSLNNNSKVSADPEQHLGWEQQHDRVPGPHRHHLAAGDHRHGGHRAPWGWHLPRTQAEEHQHQQTHPHQYRDGDREKQMKRISENSFHFHMKIRKRNNLLHWSIIKVLTKMWCIKYRTWKRCDITKKLCKFFTFKKS